MHSLILLADVTAPAGFWPVTLVGWLTAVGVILTIAVQLISMGKFLEKLNGFGKRLTAVEEKNAWLRGKAEETVLEHQRIKDAQSQLTEKVGEAKRSAEQCGIDMDNMTRRIEDKLDNMSRQVSGIDKGLSERMAGVESVLRDRSK